MKTHDDVFSYEVVIDLYKKTFDPKLLIMAGRQCVPDLTPLLLFRHPGTHAASAVRPRHVGIAPGDASRTRLARKKKKEQ